MNLKVISHWAKFLIVSEQQRHNHTENLIAKYKGFENINLHRKFCKLLINVIYSL